MWNTINRVGITAIILIYTIQLTAGSAFSRSTDNDVTRAKRQSDCRFRCNNGECIDLEFECNGIANCMDGSDETKALCGNVRCPAFLFQCKYGACISKTKLCDGEKDCVDNSDEETPSCAPTSTARDCKQYQFRCQNGECIDNLDTCDGVKTCTDGSDETKKACFGLVCPEFFYRCAYGACVGKSARCDGKNDCVDGSDEINCPGLTSSSVTHTPTSTPAGDGCILPAHPSTGRYSYKDPTYPFEYVENTYVDSSINITLSCNRGYTLSGQQYFYCLNKQWLPGLNTAACTRKCHSLPSTDTYNSHCYLRGQTVSCENPLEGTAVKIQCKPFYVFHGTRPNLLCRDGNWDTYPTPCEPVCGQKKINTGKLVIGGSDAIQDEYPWMVAVYNTSLDQKKYICGGSIISRFFVMSAAHCFTDATGVPYPKEYFTIVAGKYKRDLNILEDNMQIREIKRLIVHEDFRGDLHKYRDDIALVEVDRFELTADVRPVCLDWNNAYEDFDLSSNNIGVVAAWGFTQESSQPAEVRKELWVPYRSKDICKTYMDPELFHQYYSSDKICAGFKKNGTSACSVHSGSGLYFRSTPDMFYIRGIASPIKRADAGCDKNLLYTKVSKYLLWIESTTRRRI